MCGFHSGGKFFIPFLFRCGLTEKLFLTETAGWHRYRKEIFFLIIKVNAFEYPKEEKSYKKDGSVRRSFEGLKRQLLYLLGCSASNGPQRELSRYLIGY